MATDVRARVAERLRMPGWAVALLALSGAAFALLSATLVAVLSIALWVGIPVFVGSV